MSLARMVIIFWAGDPICFLIHVLLYPFLESHQTPYHSDVGVLIRKVIKEGLCSLHAFDFIWCIRELFYCSKEWVVCITLFKSIIMLCGTNIILWNNPPFRLNVENILEKLSTQQNIVIDPNNVMCFGALMDVLWDIVTWPHKIPIQGFLSRWLD